MGLPAPREGFINKENYPCVKGMNCWKDGVTNLCKIIDSGDMVEHEFMTGTIIPVTPTEYEFFKRDGMIMTYDKHGKYRLLVRPTLLSIGQRAL